MALLDRFRSKPAWQHEDAAVRAAAVRELPDEDQGRLLAIARGDSDPRVRRAAVRRLGSPVALGDVIREDADTSVREEAAEALAALLERSDEGAAAQAALDALQDPRHLSAVARTARALAVRRASVEKLSSPKALADVARTAEDPEVRLLALERIDDPAAVAEVALRAEHKDVATRAVERLGKDALKAVAARGRNRAAARRARALLAEAGEEAEPLKPAERRARRQEILRRLEGLARSVDFALLRVELSSAAEAWLDLAQGAAPEDESERRYLAARGALEERVAQHEAALLEQQRDAEARDAARSARSALCQETAGLEGSEPEASLDALRARYAELPAWDDPEAPTLEERFRTACAGAAERRRRFVQGEAGRARLDELVRALVAASEGGESGAAEAAALQKESGALLEVATSEQRGRYEAAVAQWRERGTAVREERAKAEAENQARLVGLIEQMEGLAKAEHPKLKDAEAALREARERLGPAGLGPLPGKRDRETLLARLKDARSALYPRVQEMRASREWAQWASAGAQEEACARAEALLLVTDMETLVREAKDLDARWGQARRGPREKTNPLLERFKAARDQIRSRCDAYFAEQARERGENLAKKLALCEQAEALQDSTDWLKTAQALVALQAQWKATGPVAQRDARKVWDRFRTACDRFFSRRKVDLSRRKEDWARNLERKEALCSKAEALAASTEWESAAAEVRSLQAEWKTVGPVRKSRSEAVWQRFRAACDAFFERYKRRAEIGRAAETGRREALCEELEALAAPGAAADAPADLMARLRGAQDAWRQGTAPAQLQERFDAAVGALVLAWPGSFQGTDLDAETNRKKRERLCARLETLLAEAPKPPETAMDLAARLKEALAANTMGARREAANRPRLAEEVESARAAWKRAGPVAGDAGRALQERFEAACRRVLDAAKRAH
jgi:hypothetical protein